MHTHRSSQRLCRWFVAPLAVAASLALGACSGTTTDDDIVPIGLSQIRQTQTEGKEGALVIIDSRSRRAYDEQRIPGARNMQFDAIPEKNATPDPAIAGYPMIVIYGEDPGSATAKALTKRMIAAGYENLYMYQGGLDEWVRSGMPTEGTKASKPQ